MFRHIKEMIDAFRVLRGPGETATSSPTTGSVPDFSKSTKESMRETLETIEFVLRKEGLNAEQRVNAILSLTIAERKFGKREQNDLNERRA